MSSGGWGEVRRGVLSKWNSKTETSECCETHTTAAGKDKNTHTHTHTHGGEDRKCVCVCVAQIKTQTQGEECKQEVKKG